MSEKVSHNIVAQQQDDLELRALELFERRHELTDDELAELADNPAMQDALLDMMDMGEAVAGNHAEQESANRSDIHTAFTSNSKFLHLSVRGLQRLFLAAACAVALLAFVFWNKANISQEADESMVAMTKPLAEGTVFEKQDNSRGVTLTCAEGSNITPTLQSSGTSVIADFTALKTAEAQEVKMDVPMGYDATVTLPDGTVAYLHPGSRLKFPTKFVGDTRQVILEGECYFKVAHDAAHPFIVSANNVLTTVLGTEFNVSTESANGTVVTLINGSVRVNHANSDAQMVIVPGQQVQLRNNQFVARTVDTSVYEAWRDGFICYDNMPMSDVMEAIGRNYNMTVQFSNRDAMQTPIRFVCERNASIDDALSLLNSLKKAAVKRRGDVIVVE